MVRSVPSAHEVLSLSISDPAARLGEQVRGSWSLNLYGTAARVAAASSMPVRTPGRWWWPAADPERAAVEAGRRATAGSRRHCAHNRLNQPGTLTYWSESCHDPQQERAGVGGVLPSLSFGAGRPGVAVRVGTGVAQSGPGLHMHFAVGRFVLRSVIGQAWDHGSFHITLLGASAGSGVLGVSRRAAGYL